MQSPGDIPALTGLRAIAALWVFAFHAADFALRRGAGEALLPIGAAGYLGVDIFFVLSGFVLALNYADERLHQNPGAWRGFLWKRLARIYPVHVAGLAFFALLVLSGAVVGIEFAQAERMTLDGLVRSSRSHTRGKFQCA